MKWMLLPLKRYADFQGRSRRKEYWMFILANIIVGIVLVLLGGIVAGGFGAFADAANPSPLLGLVFIPFGLFYLGILIPSIAVQVRRLHDLDYSGWWLIPAYLVGAIPVIGFIASVALLIFMCMPGTSGRNRFGSDPKEQFADVFS